MGLAAGLSSEESVWSNSAGGLLLFVDLSEISACRDPLVPKRFWSSGEEGASMKSGASECTTGGDMHDPFGLEIPRSSECRARTAGLFAGARFTEP